MKYVVARLKVMATVEFVEVEAADAHHAVEVAGAQGQHGLMDRVTAGVRVIYGYPGVIERHAHTKQWHQLVEDAYANRFSKATI